MGIIKRLLPAAAYQQFRNRWWRHLRPLLVDYCSIPMPWFPAVRHDDAICQMQRLAWRFHWEDRWSAVTSVARGLAALRWPFRVVVDSARELWRHGRAVQRLSGKSLAGQYLAMLRLAFGQNVPPSSFYRYRLFKPHNARRARLYLCESQMSILYPRLIGHRPNDKTLRLKHLFFEHCREFGLPTAETVAYFEHGAEVRRYVDEIPRCDIMLKPVGLAGGQGVELLRFAFDRWHGEGFCFTAEELVARCRRVGRVNPCILQVRLENHVLLTELSGESLATMRVITFRTVAGACTTFIAGLRTPTGQSVVDNWDAGGLICCVDLATGVCQPAIAKDAELGEFARHPDTGQAIEGFVVPFFDEAIAVCLRAHNSVPWAPFVGWDVALTPDGPRLVEANPNWGIESPQAAPDRPLGESCYPHLFLAHLAAASSES